MKKRIKALCVLIVLTIVMSCIISAIPFQAAETDYASTGETYNYNLASNVQDGEILHAWNVSYSNIKSNLPNIAAAGYSTIQTSPVQQPKDYRSTWTDVSGQWWKLYQPLSFSIARSSWLGTKSDLTSLCSEAHRYGIKIICDIVVNHMANDGDPEVLNRNIESYEPTIYSNSSKYFHSYVSVSDGSIPGVVRANIGMPDLNTSDSYVQERVTSLLEECIDCGVDGFRFDAAKHIETPSDGSYASDFWPNVLGATTSYAQSNYNKSPYYYGEILNTCGNGRSFLAYSQYMSVTDNVTGNNIMWSVQNGNASGAAQSYFNTGLSADKIVMWAESHDTYADDTSSSVSQTVINKAYCLGAARNKIAMLYLMRTDGASMGSIGSTSYKSSAVSAANNFHNYFIGCGEYLSSYNNFAVCERYSNDNTKTGTVIVNCGGTATNVSNLPLNKMKSGTYTDAVSGNTFTVSNGRVSGNIGDTGVAVIYKTTSTVETQETTSTPTISADEGFYLVGTLNGRDCWNSLTPERKLSPSSTVENQYELDYTFYDGDEIKVAGFFDNVVTYYPSSGNNYTCTKAGNKTGLCTLYFNPDGNHNWSYAYLTVKQKSVEPVTEPTEQPTEVTEPTEAPLGPIDLPDGYYLVGTINGENCWADNITADRKLHLDKSYTSGERYVLYYTLHGRDELKVVKVENGTITKWYKDETKSSYTLNNRYPGANTYMITFMPNGYKSWIYTYINVTRYTGVIPPYDDETQATTVAPTTAAPTTIAPTTVAPTTIEPTTVEPTTVAPTTSVLPTQEEPSGTVTYKYGDTNLNGTIEITDVTLIQMHLARYITLPFYSQQMGHVTFSDELFIGDATVLQRYLARYQDKNTKIGTTLTVIHM